MTSPFTAPGIPPQHRNRLPTPRTMRPILKLPTSLLLCTLLLTAPTNAQLPLQQPMAGIQLPPSSESSQPAPNNDIILSDILGTNRHINIFAGFTRDIPQISTRLESSSQNTTLLAPLNSAIQALPRKPWEDPRDYASLGEQAYEGKEGEDRAHRNLRRFVEAHVVPKSGWEEGEKVETLSGGKVWWETQQGKRLIMPGSVEVEGTGRRVGNGEIWVLKGALNYA